MDSHVIMVALTVAVAVVLGYFLVMRVFFKESKELDKKIDYSKVKEWKDDED
jgi:low affinity Fe/Cu permease